MVASFFFYYNYKFQQYKFLDFSKITLYTNNDIFIPKKEYYTLLIFSSKRDSLEKILSKINTHYPILVIDFFQERKKIPNVIYTTAGINTLLKIVQYLNIYEVPVVLNIKRYNNSLYKQDSRLLIIK